MSEIPPDIQRVLRLGIMRLGRSVVSPSYIVFKVGGMVYAKNGMTGRVEFGGADFATVLQLAVDALPNGGIVFVKRGTYDIYPAVKGITLRSKIKLIGENVVVNVHIPRDVNNITAIHIIDAGDVLVSGFDFRFKGEGGGSTTYQSAIRIHNSRRVTVEKCKFIDERGALADAYWIHALQIGRFDVPLGSRLSKDITVRDCYFYSDGRGNRAFMAIRVSDAERVTISNCYIQARELDEPYNSRIGFAPLQIQSANHVVVERSIFVGGHHNLVTTGVYDPSDRCVGLRFENSVFLGGFDDAIDPNHSDDGVVVGCYMDNTIGAPGPEGDGVSLENCARWTIAGNFIKVTRCAINTPSGSNPDNVITGNWLYGRFCGVQLSNTLHSVVAGNRIESPRAGIRLEYPHYPLINGNTIIANAGTVNVSTTVIGVEVLTCPTDVVITNNRIHAMVSSETPGVDLRAYGIYVRDSIKGVIKGNYIAPWTYHPTLPTTNRWLHLDRADGDYPVLIDDNIVGGDALIQGAVLPTFRRNIGYATERSGVATIPAGSTRVTVAHGLVKAPTKILVTPYANIRVWVENIGSTSFDIVTDVAPATDVNVAWYAEV